MASPGLPTAVYFVGPSAAELPNAIEVLHPFWRNRLTREVSKRVELIDMRVSELGEYLFRQAIASTLDCHTTPANIDSII